MPQIITPAQARQLLEGTTEGRWEWYNSDPTHLICHPLDEEFGFKWLSVELGEEASLKDADLLAAAPSLAATVIAYGEAIEEMKKCVEDWEINGGILDFKYFVRAFDKILADKNLK